MFWFTPLASGIFPQSGSGVLDKLPQFWNVPSAWQSYWIRRPTTENGPATCWVDSLMSSPWMTSACAWQPNPHAPLLARPVCPVVLFPSGPSFLSGLPVQRPTSVLRPITPAANQHSSGQPASPSSLPPAYGYFGLPPCRIFVG